MAKTGRVDLPLHSGRAPRWLFGRMVKLARPISEIIIDEYGQDNFLKKLSDPYFFQSLSCVLGFDWHSSGVTTTATGALKMALKNTDMGIKVAGGKGKNSRKAPQEIIKLGDDFNLKERKINELVRNSKMSAKVDNSLIQDTYNLYHHSFFINEKGKWAVIQQGLDNDYARRYHWLSDDIRDMVENEKPIASMKKGNNVLNLTSKDSRETRKTSLDLIKDNPYNLKKYSRKESGKFQKELTDFGINHINEFKLPRRHHIEKIDLGNFKALEKAYEVQPRDYEELVSIRGVGPKTIRALSLISNLIHGSKADWKDPAKYSYAHGGKDGYPEPVDTKNYDRNIEILNQAIREAKIGKKDKIKTLERMKKMTPQ